MKRVGVYEVKTNFPRLLKRISKGDRIVITKHGTAIAVLQKPEITEKSDPSAVIAEMREFREQHSLAGLTIRELIEEGRHGIAIATLNGKLRAAAKKDRIKLWKQN